MEFSTCRARGAPDGARGQARSPRPFNSSSVSFSRHRHSSAAPSSPFDSIAPTRPTQRPLKICNLKDLRIRPASRLPSKSVEVAKASRSEFSRRRSVSSEKSHRPSHSYPPRKIPVQTSSICHSDQEDAPRFRSASRGSKYANKDPIHGEQTLRVLQSCHPAPPPGKAASQIKASMATSNRPASSPLKKNWPPTLFPLATHHLKIVSSPLELCRKHTGGLARQDQMVSGQKNRKTPKSDASLAQW